MKTRSWMLGVAMLATACIPDTGDSGSSVPQGSYVSPVCEAVSPEVLLLVDTSDRMADPSGYKQGNNYYSRIDLVVRALKRNLPHLKKEVLFGLLTFPFVDHRDANGNDRICPGSCEVGEVEVNPGDPYGWIVSRLEHIQTGGKAAVAKALWKARDYYRDRPSSNRIRSVVLFTAGGDQCDGEVLQAIAALQEIGVATYVISFENGTDRDLLIVAAAAGSPAGRQAGVLRMLTPDSGIELIEDALSLPGKVEVCNGIDDDCDGLTDEDFDQDGDGWATCAGDCNDSDAEVNPGIVEGGRLAPYEAARVVTWFQGTTANGGEVQAVNSNPARALTLQAGEAAGAAFALGFDGFIEVEFDCPIRNGTGMDLRVFEWTPTGDTGAAETAAVYAWNAAAQAWVLLGTATNQDGQRPNARNDFDLGDLPATSRIRLVNTSVRSGAGDGFDVNGIYALHDCGTCDGKDNSCDGQVDEGYAIGTECSMLQGGCQTGGHLVCSDDHLSAWCDAPPAIVGSETCNGIDDDCDGQVDEGLREACQTSCGSGHRACQGGAWTQCIIDRPNPEVCNGVDDNCDGRVDEGFDVGASCQVGKMGCGVTGVKVCSEDGLETICIQSEGQGSGIEVCNGLDDDCDGVIDNGKGLCPAGQVCFKGQCVYD
ncbi:MAG TPA: VWA domain-containing protein [Myxococcota bacterium]|nr:VWA domain-containing protein [Myxococcota bacterium]HQK52346.1 VWA domain-containing protein [Myxococcota bacterium]